MRRPRCQKDGQELTLPGESPRIYECNTPGCAVMRFDEDDEDER